MIRAFSKKRFGYVFLITTLVFLLGLYFGYLITNSKLRDISEITQQLQTQTTTTEIEYLLFNEEPCLLEIPDRVGDELYQLASKLTFMEEHLGKKDKEVLILKEYYSLLEMRHWLLLKKIKRECERDTNLILYFYGESCNSCDEQGFLLTYLREKYPELKLSVYSFDADLQNSALVSLKRFYNVSEYPALIINDKAYSGFVGRKHFEEIFKIRE